MNIPKLSQEMEEKGHPMEAVEAPETQEERVIRMVPNKETWPLMSQGHKLLAVKRWYLNGRTPDFGMMMDVPGDQMFRVYTEMRQFSDLDLDDLNNNEQEMFTTPEELVEAGWRVD